MRKITKELVLLVAVFIIYFGYSAWVDSTALYHVTQVLWNGQIVTAGDPNFASAMDAITNVLSGTPGEKVATVVNYIGVNITKANAGLMNIHGASVTLADGTTGTVSVIHSGVMAQDSLLYAVLTPFKLVFVGGVFALLIPLTKSIFFGTIVGIKGYVKARRNNVLFNYQAAIAFVQNLQATLATGDYEQIKAQYKAYSGLAFQPKFLDIMMEEIGESLIRQQDMSVYIKPADVVMRSIKQMYEKERKLAISMRPTEMFFDFKRGYEYTSVGSKYSIAYFKSLDTGADTAKKLGWKLFSLEMYKFMTAMIFALVPMIIVAVIVIACVGAKGSSAAVKGVVPVMIFGVWMVFAVAIHAVMVFSKSQYRVMWKSLVVPAVIYYGIMLLIAGTFVVGLNAVIALGSMIAPSTNLKMWNWFSAVANLVLTTTLMMYVMSTLMDGLTSPLGMTRKLFVDGVVIPLTAWVIAMALNLAGNFGYNSMSEHDATVLNSVSFAVAIATWIYLSISGVLLNNIVMPSRKRKMALQAELADEGLQDLEKQQKADSKRKAKKSSKSKRA